ncbi:hypothetical protein TNCV_1033361 [Trichonephila clavipes]|nr:hypothetical protein TNCV_1033361 [Trichonephila clavipes]
MVPYYSFDDCSAFETLFSNKKVHHLISLLVFRTRNDFNWKIKTKKLEKAFEKPSFLPMYRLQNPFHRNASPPLVVITIIPIHIFPSHCGSSRARVLKIERTLFFAISLFYNRSPSRIRIFSSIRTEFVLFSLPFRTLDGGNSFSEDNSRNISGKPFFSCRWKSIRRLHKDVLIWETACPYRMENDFEWLSPSPISSNVA